MTAHFDEWKTHWKYTGLHRGLDYMMMLHLASIFEASSTGVLLVVGNGGWGFWLWFSYWSWHLFAIIDIEIFCVFDTNMSHARRGKAKFWLAQFTVYFSLFRILHYDNSLSLRNGVWGIGNRNAHDAFWCTSTIAERQLFSFSAQAATVHQCFN